jgi:1-aminocyclopropane-1-carboxylate deaminase/D-cysteine desulfhydrase-like pyridoxal-dependent ACC family enzyme
VAVIAAEPTPLQEITLAGVRLLVKRDDLIHPLVPGNKWRKLKYNLAAARAAGHDTLLTFGGAYSNHIHAVASAGKLFGFHTIGVIRGEEHLPHNEVLRHAVDCGMTLTYVDRAAYRHKEALFAEFADRAYLLPEGGTNDLAVRGCAELVAEIDEPFDYLCCPVGTGGTLAGVVVGLAGRAHAVGFSVLKGGGFLRDTVRTLVGDRDNWSIELDYHFGGYARETAELRAFVDDFTATHGIPLDHVYTGKMMYGVVDQIRAGRFAPGTTIVAVHTGGVRTASSPAR